VNGTRVLVRRCQYPLMRTKGKVSKFLATSDIIPLVHSEVDAPYHHRTNADIEYPTKGRTVNGDDLADILAIDIECGADGLGLEELHQEMNTETDVNQLTFTV
jgi:hypothetical protein